MSDKYSGYTRGLTSPAEGAFAITPNDGADLSQVTRAIYVGGAGDIRATFVDGSTETIPGCPAGQERPYRVKKVFATGTTATDLIGLV